MTDTHVEPTGVTRAVARFPEAAARLRRLAMADADFRELCEEYGLAQQSLAGYEARPDAAERTEIAEYRILIAELEDEISRLLTEAGQKT